jgi:peptidoglycan/xylan/chitin deacetylase (PgdA/CDA1 family)
MDLLLRQRTNSLTTRLVPTKWVRSRLAAPVASMTFDDFPRSAWTIGGPILARYGAKATYYTSGRFCGVTEDGLEHYTADDLRALVAAGHEVGCHTHDHLYGSRVGTAALKQDIARNREVLADVLGHSEFSSFAYPYGDASPRTKRLFAGLFPTSRGIRAGVNAGIVDLAQLKSVALERRRWSEARIEGFVTEAQARKGWLTFFTHDVSDDPTPFGCTPAMLEHALETLQAADIPVLTVKQALARVTGES